AAKNTGKILGMSKHVFAALVAVVAVGAAVGVGVVLTQQPALEDWYDSNAAQGQFEGKSKEEIQAALNEEVAKGMMNISIAASITFPDGASEGEARIENIAANPMDQKVVITLKDSGETVYESAAIAPDQHIQTIKLTKDLDPGQYAAVATFTGYDRETHKQTGQAAAEIVLNVEG
ncbi:flagellar protein FliS, partial [uncultured Eggerthella sp.]